MPRFEAIRTRAGERASYLRAGTKLSTAGQAELEEWALRVLDAPSLDAVFQT